MRRVLVLRYRRDAVGDDLPRPGEGIPQLHVLQDVQAVGESGIPVDDARLVRGVDVDGGESVTIA